MYIRRTKTRNTLTGERYFSHRLVKSVRVAGKVKQKTLLNLGHYFDIEQSHWPVLCHRVEKLLSGQPSLFENEHPMAVEREAHHIAAQLLGRQDSVEVSAKKTEADMQSVDIESLEMVRPRTVGVESVGLWAQMLKALKTPKGAMIVMDAGIASEDNLIWLRDNDYRYLVVSREKSRQFDPEQAVAIQNNSGETVKLQKITDEEETRLYCHSESRENKEQAISKRFAEKFEAALQKLHDGLSKPRYVKRIDKVWERIGRLKEKSHGMGQHYHIDVQADDTGKKAIAITWEHRPVANTLHTNPGVYCLRSNELNWDEEKLWRTYIMLTDLESVFRSLKSELGLRPIYHHAEKRVDGHLFITVLTYQFVQIIRKQLAEKGIHGRWQTLRDTLNGQQRVTSTFKRADQLTLHVRKATRAEPEQLIIYQALDLNPAPGGVKKMVA